ncbi:MAG: hypothetical protein ACR2I2_00545 [Bryobacteraceae bacterium]
MSGELMMPGIGKNKIDAVPDPKLELTPGSSGPARQEIPPENRTMAMSGETEAALQGCNQAEG